MIVLCVMNCPPGLRGDLSKWLNEVNTGVYVGRLNARVREELWNRVCSNIKSGQATMVYSTNNEQGFAFLTHNTTWIPVDYEGITLMKKPFSVKEDKEQSSFLQPGFSKAAKYEKIKHFHNNTKKQPGYVIIGIQTTGSDCNVDRIIEIGMLKIEENKISQTYQCLIPSERRIPDHVVKLTGITNEMLDREGVPETEVLKKVQEFIDDDLIIGYNIQDTVNFIQRLGERNGQNTILKTVRDIKHLAKRKLDDVENYRLETMASYFSLDVSNVHRALANCMLIHRIYCELNKL